MGYQKQHGSPCRVAVVVTDGKGTKVLVKDHSDSQCFIIPIYTVRPDIQHADPQFNARLQLQTESGISHADGHWTPVCDVQLSGERSVHLYIAAFLKAPKAPSGWHWCELEDFRRKALLSRSAEPEVQDSMSLATASLMYLLALQVLGYIPDR